MRVFLTAVIDVLTLREGATGGFTLLVEETFLVEQLASFQVLLDVRDHIT